MGRIGKISVSIITGFLGAGKTTFINNLLKKYPETQFALVENEFGDVPIDKKLIKGVDASLMFELKEGCICCTLTDEFELVLNELAERYPNTEHLLIETTGVADPVTVISPFFRDESLKNIYHLNGTICLVDAQNFDAHPGKQTSLKQIVIADLVLVNKSENLPEKQIQDFSKMVQKINPFCKIITTKFGGASEIDLNSIIQKEKTLFDFTNFTDSASHPTFKTRTLSFNHPLNREKFIDWISYTLDIYKNEIYRAKGILCFENEPYEYILQGVAGSFELVEGEDFANVKESKLVFIGLDVPLLQY
ncbi:MAG: GTP-binding protein [Prolixibacteraceae bacterium]|jgi:G3E family GTPase|nr:GTP-binding protein [Prolixibacteraceae bacterium]MBT6006952.1 GTP-binding protein [Prolixibacteraceae bacterium]MBT6765634.1 GTP-binding protein [Prolixibacteraceae bacterium]MBT7000682.1 GTP-binding protein [Prolixibacteraceae bacterium]MBT7396148.1 GTP-binding protein [Prolixibacteraceae bacterium]